MPRNVELKCAVDDPIKLVKSIIALCQKEPIIITQKDTFFDAPKSRLKLREIKNNPLSELISYNRADSTGPKVSKYSITRIPAKKAENLLKTLDQSIGVLGVVKKVRHLSIFGQTRIHFDQVEGLGTFLELEVVLSDGPKVTTQPADISIMKIPDQYQSVEDGEFIAKEVLGKLVGLGEHLQGAYFDMFTQKQTQPENH